MPEPITAVTRPERGSDLATLRAEVLRHAATLLADGGAAALTARTLARTVGVSTKIIYSHFGGMPEIMAGVHALGFAELTRTLEAGDDRSLSRVDRLWRVARGYRAFARKHEHLFELMFGPRQRQLAPAETDRGGAAASLQLVARIIAPPGAADSAVDAVRPLAHQFFSATHGPVSLESSGWLSRNATEVFDGVVSQAIRAAISPSARTFRT